MTPEQQLDQQRTLARVATARVAQEEAGVRRAESELERTIVRAPYTGSVVARHLHEGAWVGPGPGAVVITLQQVGGFEAHVNVPESSPVPVAIGDAVELVIDGLSGRLASQVRAVNARIDPESRTYSVRIPIPTTSSLLADAAGKTRERSITRSSAPAHAVKSGAFVRAEIRPTPRSGVLVVDRSALLLRDGRSYVFKILRGDMEGSDRANNDRADDDRVNGTLVAQTPVRVGARGTQSVEILDGLSEGDAVVVGTIVERLADGSRVSLERGEADTTESHESTETDA